MFGSLHPAAENRPLKRRDYVVACILFRKRYPNGPYDENESFWYLTWLWRNAQTRRLDSHVFHVGLFRPRNPEIEDLHVDEPLGQLVSHWYRTKKQADWIIWIKDTDKRIAIAMGLHRHLQRPDQTCPFLFGPAMEDILSRICLTERISEWYIRRNYMEPGF